MLIDSVFNASIAVAAAAGVVLVGLGRWLRLATATIVKMVLAQVIGGALFAVGAVALLLNGYSVEYDDGPMETLVFAVPALIAGALISLAAWLPVLRGWHRRHTRTPGPSPSACD